MAQALPTKTCFTSGLTQYTIVTPGDDAFHGPAVDPALLSSDGCAYLTPGGHVMALDPRGEILWRRERPSEAPGSLSANCLLMVCDGELCAVSSDGTRTALWRPPEPVATAPVLARGRIHLATARRLHVLEPVD